MIKHLVLRIGLSVNKIKIQFHIFDLELDFLENCNQYFEKFSTKSFGDCIRFNSGNSVPIKSKIKAVIYHSLDYGTVINDCY